MNIETNKMVHLKKIALSIYLVVMCVSVSGQNDFCSARNTSFRDGEKLTFRVYYNMGFVWITAGNADFTTRGEEIDGHKVYHITGDGKTAKSYEWFYKVNDEYETYIDRETMLPERFVRNVNEGGFKINQDVAFHHNKDEAISAIFYARNIDYYKYRPGDKIPFNMFLDDKLYSLYIKYVGKEDIHTKMGRYHAIKIVPLLIEGTIFEGGEKMTVWVSDDENHLPLRVDSPILVGSIKVDLISYDNLRNPFSSMISKETE